MASMNGVSRRLAVLALSATVLAGWMGCDLSSTAIPRKAPTGGVTVVPDAGPPPAFDAAAPLNDTQLHADLMLRWNRAVDALGGDSGFDFHWRSFNQFPHPTYKGGTAAAYQAFAAVLIAFFQGDGTFDFLSGNNLFTVPLYPRVNNDHDTTFRQLAADFPSDQYTEFAMLSDDTRQTLQGISDRIELALAR